MALTLTRAGKTTSVWFKVLLYGNSGAGKTWAACQSALPGSGQNVLALLTEANGVQTARHANPDVLLPSWPLMERSGQKDDDGRPIMVQRKDASGTPMVRHYATSMKEVREVVGAVINREIQVDILVVDGLTEIQALMKDAIISQKKGNDEADKDDANKGGKGVFSRSDWGILNEWMRRFMRTLRDLPVHVVSTALADVEVEEAAGGGSTRYIVPAFQGRKLHNQVAGFQNVVAYLYTKGGRSKGKNTTERKAMVQGPTTILCKPAHPLGGVLEVEVWEWLKLLGNPPEQTVGTKATQEDLEAASQAMEEAEKDKPTQEDPKPAEKDKPAPKKRTRRTTRKPPAKK